MGFSTKGMVVRVEAPSMEAEEEELQLRCDELNEAKARTAKARMRVVAALDQAADRLDLLSAKDKRRAAVKHGLAITGD